MNKLARYLLVFTFVMGALAVIIGAFGAHGLSAVLSDVQLKVYQTGVQYHFYHVLVAGLACVLMVARFPQSKMLLASIVLFNLGVILFSGSLYSIALGAPRWLGAITPIGGLNFILGWLVLAVGIFLETRKNETRV